MNIERTEKYLSDKEIAARFGVHRLTPWDWCRKGIFPRPVKLGPNCTRWRLSDIEAWEAKREVQA